MRESDFQSRLTRWASHNVDHSCAIEAKLVKGGRMQVSSVRSHQILALEAVTDGTLAFKLMDNGFSQQPFDMFVLNRAQGYIAVMFWRRGVNHFYLIPVHVWIEATADVKSLTESDIAQIGLRRQFPAIPSAISKI